MVDIPLTKDEIEKLKRSSAKFAAKCYEEDSLIRGMMWSNLVDILHEIMIEEENHDFKFPSIHNPNK